ncbi:MAG TPA: SIMPL domain-containing protein [Rhizomicrobium sp.]|jgi:hypothetical protein
MHPFARAAAIALLFLARPAFAEEPRILTVSGHGEAAAVPDQAHLSAGVTTQARTAAAALAQNAAQMNAVFAALTKLGVPEKKIQTSNFSVSPQYPQSNNDAPPRIVGYQVANQVDVTLDDAKKLGPVLDALVGAGANQIDGVSFGFADPKGLAAKARADAVTDATERAQTYARAAGVSLGPIVSITEAGEGNPAPMPMMRAMEATAARTPVVAGEQTVTATVTIVWELR